MFLTFNEWRKTMASYVQSVIGAGEEIKYSAQVSVWSMIPLFILGFLLLGVFGLGIVCFLIAFLRYKTTELAVTNKKVIAKFGFIQRDTIELLLNKAESIQVKQSILGRMLNYGTIIVSGAGNPQAPIPGIADPLEFRRQFMEIQEGS
jgi:uncharacterized membrane protein YdbT with pleckstrin-like domain